MAAYGESIELLVGTEVPFSAGATVSAELPYRLRFDVGLGGMPSPYLDLVNEVCTSFGWYDDTTAALIDAALHDAIVVRLRAGWRPFPKLGFVAMVGGGPTIALGGLTGVTTIEAVTGQSIERSPGEVSMSARATAWQLDVRAGWELLPHKNLAVRLELGGTFTVAASSVIEPDWTSRRPELLAPILEEGEAWIEDSLTSYVHAPVIGVSVGPRLARR